MGGLQGDGVVVVVGVIVVVTHVVSECVIAKMLCDNGPCSFGGGVIQVVLHTTTQ